MPLESASYISDLNASNPVVTDPTSQGDDHIRLVKAVLKTTFPNLSGAVSATQDELNAVAGGTLEASDGSAAAPSVNFGKATTPDASTGLYHAGAGKIAIAGRLTGNGAVPVGSLHKFPKEPPSLGKGGVNTNGPYEYLELDGSVWNIADYPDLGAYLSNTFGGDGVNTFAVPNEADTGRFERSRTSTLLAGTYQASAFKTHAHTSGQADSGGAHTHGVSVSDPGHHHTTVDPSQGVPTYGGGATGGATNNASGPSSPVRDLTQLVTTQNTTGISVSTTTAGSAHTHTLTIPSGHDGGDANETRPEAFVVVSCIKT